MLNPNYIEGKYREFSELIGINDPAKAPDIQRKETRRAFFAGAKAIIKVMMSTLEYTDSPDTVTPGDEQVMRFIVEEMDQFARDVVAGLK